ncbi:MAG: hypothetical protein H7A23_22720 [Leptospiraceae bacterium]|nr:hypothetical protein [Leptospiraceae bacterium]MCP5497378.1 hypothetical protein [Leptospiraceae bacterium]
MKNLIIYIFIVLNPLLITKGLLSDEIKNKKIYITIDKSGSMNNDLSKEILENIHILFKQLFQKIELKDTNSSNIITYNKRELKQFSQFSNNDYFTVFHYGSKINICLNNISYNHINDIFRCLPETNNFSPFFNENLSVMYLPEMEILKNFNPLLDHYWIDLSDRRPDDTKNIPDSILKEWDRLHTGVNVGNVILRIHFQNGIYLTMTKIEYTQSINFQVKTEGRTNQIVFQKISLGNEIVRLESEPFEIIHLVNQARVDVKRLEFQTLTFKQEKIEFHTNTRQEYKNGITLFGEFPSALVNNMINHGVLIFKYSLGNSTIEEIIPNVSIIIDDSKKINYYYVYGFGFIFLLISLFFLYIKKLKDGFKEKNNFLNIKLTTSQGELMLPKSFEISTGQKISFEQETATMQQCIGYLDVRMAEQYIELKSVSKKEFELINKREPERNKVIQLPGEFELRNKFGRTVKIKIEEQ